MPEFRFSPRPNRAHEIPWEPWSAEPFDRAKREGKPILLSISAVWCHWCHVMDETTYSDSGVIKAVSEQFVPVRVDNDERPDINARYNMGGWPTTAFLAPDGATLTGTTYLPPEQMRKALDEISTWYAHNTKEIAEHSEVMKSMRPPDETAAEGELQVSGARDLADAIASTFDEEYGGFGNAPKFPQPELLEFLLAQSQADGEERFRAMVIRTLLGMSRGGMYDHVEGGFFRYSTTRDWSVPHFEKMAEDHAGLLRVLALLIRRTRHVELHATLRSALDYVNAVLRDPQTSFFAGSQDADEEYYTLPLDERRKHGEPYVDRTVYADRNAALAGAYCLAGSALDDDTAISFGLATLDTLHERMHDTEGLLFHMRRIDENPAVRGLLVDQVAYLRALLVAYEVTKEPRFLTRAIALSSAIIARFASPDGGFYDHAGIEGRLGRLEMLDRPIVDNALLAESLLRLAELDSGSDAAARYRDIAKQTLLVHARTFKNAGSFGAAYARALLRYFAPPVREL